MDSGGDGHSRQPGGNELQHGHLGSGVLHGNPIGPQSQVGHPAFNILGRRVIDVRVEDLL